MTLATPPSSHDGELRLPTWNDDMVKVSYRADSDYSKVYFCKTQASVIHLENKYGSTERFYVRTGSSTTELLVGRRSSTSSKGSE